MPLEEPVQFVFVAKIPNQAAVAASEALLAQRGPASSSHSQKPKGVRPEHGSIPIAVLDQSSGHDTLTIAFGAWMHCRPPNFDYPTNGSYIEKQNETCQCVGDRKSTLC
jgi:hypothetical protein